MSSIDQRVETNTWDITSPSYNINTTAIAVEKIEDRLHNWDMPKYEIEEIYKIKFTKNKKVQIVKVMKTHII